MNLVLLQAADGRDLTTLARMLKLKIKGRVKRSSGSLRATSTEGPNLYVGVTGPGPVLTPEDVNPGTTVWHVTGPYSWLKAGAVGQPPQLSARLVCGHASTLPSTRSIQS